MKKLLLTFHIGALSLFGNAADILPGVSAQLAQERKMAIENVSYDLTLSVTEDLNQPVTGVIDIDFDYKGAMDGPLQIDFNGDTVYSIEVNGTAIAPVVKSEHILVPSETLKPTSNKARIAFAASDAALNRNPGYMYSLFVPAQARTAFPCFDQPNLRANFKLRLDVPERWKTLQYSGNHTLPTYLMSWVAGDYQQDECQGITVLHRQTDSLKKAQIPEICALARKAQTWLEDYTASDFPFDINSMAILPGYQFGGMEHPEAIQYHAETMFLEPNPTPEEIMARYELIAHETAHMWWGDMVTMRWFDEVWTKEVFANFMAAKMAEDEFPEIDHDLNFVRAHYPYALSTDRTDGTHPIAQPLDNLNQAGLLYGNIIYDKAPIMMRMLERRMGAEPLRQGLQAYLRKFAWGNSTWDDLVAILDSVAPEANVRDFSQAWVKESGMPTIHVDYDENSQQLKIRQEDPTGAGTIWPQSFTVTLVGSYNDQAAQEIKVDLFDKETVVEVPYADIGTLMAVIPNSKGDGYGYFSIRGNEGYPRNWFALSDAGKYGVLLNMTEAWIRGDLPARTLAVSALANITQETNPLVASACADAIAATVAQRQVDEALLWTALPFAQAPSVKQRILRHIYGKAVKPESAAQLYDLWKAADSPLLNKNDYTSMAYRLAVLMPDRAQEILNTERERIQGDEDGLREFDFVSRACINDPEQRDALFQSFLKAENRHPEPWTVRALSLLCDPARDPECTAYLTRALDALPEIQATSDIFFPGKWLKALVGGLHSPQARDLLRSYCSQLPEPSSPLSRKLLESSYVLRALQ